MPNLSFLRKRFTAKSSPTTEVTVKDTRVQLTAKQKHKLANQLYALYYQPDNTKLSLLLEHYQKQPHDFVHMLRTMPDPNSGLVAATVMDLHINSSNQCKFDAFWWGYTLYLPPIQVKRLLSVSRDQLKVIITTLSALAFGPLVTVVPYLAAISAFISLEAELIASCEQGNGVVIASIWPCPGIFIAWAYEPSTAVGPLPSAF